MRVMTIGTFDLFHRGHVKLLATCRKIAGPKGEVIVGVNSDQFVREYKGKSAIMDEQTRQEVVAACRYADRVPLNVDNGSTLIHFWTPDILVIGNDWATRDYYEQIGMTQDDLDFYGITLLYTTYTLGVSASDYRRRLNGI